MTIALGSMLLCRGQAIQNYKDKTFVFNFYEQGKACDVLGITIDPNPIVMLKDALFTVERVVDDTLLVIRFLNWKSGSEKSAIYNYESTEVIDTKVDKNGIKSTKKTYNRAEKFFAIPKSVFEKSCSEYTVTQKWDITLGTLMTPFKLRNDPFQFTTNLNLGTMIVGRINLKHGFNIGASLGLSLSSVQLDSLSTNGTVTAATERPAFTPSVGIIFGYKNINLTLSRGWDFINKNSSIERSWVYQGKPWFGLGIGISLFKIDSGNSTPTGQVED